MATPTEQADPVHGYEAVRWGGWSWRKPRRGEWFRTCSYCGSIHPEDLAPKLGTRGPCTGCGVLGIEGHYRSTISPAVHRGVDNGEISREDMTPDELRRLDVPEHSYDPGGPYASWADQKYGWPHKFYVEGLRPEARYAKMLHFYGSAPERGNWGGPDAVWVEGARATRAERRILTADGVKVSEDRWFCLAPRATLHAKFYTVHLADPAVPDEAKEQIYAASGLRFHFRDAGRVGWHSAAVPCEEAHPG